MWNLFDKILPLVVLESIDRDDAKNQVHPFLYLFSAQISFLCIMISSKCFFMSLSQVSANGRESSIGGAEGPAQYFIRWERSASRLEQRGSEERRQYFGELQQKENESSTHEGWKKESTQPRVRSPKTVKCRRREKEKHRNRQERTARCIQSSCEPWLVRGRLSSPRYCPCGVHRTTEAKR